METTCDAGAGFAGNTHALLNKTMLYLNRANNAHPFRPTGVRAERRRSDARCSAVYLSEQIN
jgi:hypothetical protein